MKLALFVAVLLAVFAGCEAANDTWTVMSENIMTICMALDFFTSTVGVVSGMANGAGPEIKRTTDAGVTWDDVDHESALLMYMCMAFTDTEHGVTAGLGFDRWEASSSYTKDAGLTWNLTDDRNLIASYQDCESVASVEGMFVMPGFWENVLIGTSGEGVAISTNYGRDFSHHEWGVDTEARYASFGDSNNGWISGGTWPEDEYSEKFYHRHSQFIGFNKDDNGDMSVSFVPRPRTRDTVDGFIGVIAKTSDAGETWTVQFNDTGRLYFNGIYAVDDSNVWAVSEGDEGAWVWHTADGGSTWDNQLFVSGASMLTVKFFDTLEGWVAGSVADGVGLHAGMWHTVDGGISWELMEVRGYYVNDLDLLDRDHVYASAFTASGSSSAILQYSPSD